MGKRFLVLAAVVLMWSSIAWARPALYVGMEAGYTSLNHLVELQIGSFPGLQLTPVVGIVPLSELSGFSVELNFMMELFGWESQVPPQELRAWILSPQLVAVYTFLEEPVRPFAGLGLGVNVNLARYGREVFDDDLGLKEMTTSSVEIPVSLAVVLKGGVRVAIPSSGFDLLAFLRYNLNFVGNVWLDNELLLAAMNCSTFSFGLGAAYRF